MNRSYSKIRHIRESNSLLESRTILSEQDGNAMYPGQVDKTENVITIVNKVATEGIKFVTPQMISSPQFKGSYSGYQFGGNFDKINYQWDCNGVEGMSGIRGMVNGEIITETVENMLVAIKKTVTDAKPGIYCVGFYSPASKFIIYINTSNKPICLNF